MKVSIESVNSMQSCISSVRNTFSISIAFEFELKSRFDSHILWRLKIMYGLRIKKKVRFLLCCVNAKQVAVTPGINAHLFFYPCLLTSGRQFKILVWVESHYVVHI